MRFAASYTAHARYCTKSSKILVGEGKEWAHIRAYLLDYFFVKLMPVFSLMPMLEPPFSATRYASFFLFMLVLLLVFVTSFLAAYACFRRLCSSPRFLPLGMPVFLVYARTYARFCDLIFGCLFLIFVFLYFCLILESVLLLYTTVKRRCLYVAVLC